MMLGRSKITSRLEVGGVAGATDLSELTVDELAVEIPSFLVRNISLRSSYQFGEMAPGPCSLNERKL